MRLSQKDQEIHDLQVKGRALTVSAVAVAVIPQDMEIRGCQCMILEQPITSVVLAGCRTEIIRVSRRRELWCMCASLQCREQH